MKSALLVNVHPKRVRHVLYSNKDTECPYWPNCMHIVLEVSPAEFDEASFQINVLTAALQSG